MTVARSGRFAGERAPAFVALNSSLALDWRLWPEDIEGSVAHARALRGAGVLTGVELRPSRTASRPSAARSRPAASCPSDADEDVHMAVERRLTELVGEAGAKLHTGRSRNDQVVTDVRLHLRRVLERQDAALDALQQRAARARRRARRDGHAGVHAPAARAGHVAGAAPARLLLDARARPRPSGRRARGLPRAAARRGRRRGPRTTSSTAPGVAADLGFERVRENSLDAVASRDFVVDYLAAAAQLGGHLSRLGAELVLWATSEFGFVRAARRLQRRLEHHAAEEEPGRRRADAGRRSAADRRPRRPPRRAPRPAARLQHRPARGQALPLRRRRLPRPAPAGRARPARGRDLRRGAHGGGLRLRSSPPPTSPTTWWARACRSARRTTSPARSCAAASKPARASRDAGLDDLRWPSRRPSPRTTTSCTSPPPSWRASARAGGSAPVRVREQLERARAALAARPCC